MSCRPTSLRSILWSRLKHRTVRQLRQLNYLRHRPTYQDLKWHRLPSKHEVTLYFAGPCFSSMGLIKLLDHIFLRFGVSYMYVANESGCKRTVCPVPAASEPYTKQVHSVHIPFTVYLCVAGTLRASVRDIRREQVG